MGRLTESKSSNEHYGLDPHNIFIKKINLIGINKIITHIVIGFKIVKVGTNILQFNYKYIGFKLF